MIPKSLQNALPMPLKRPKTIMINLILTINPQCSSKIPLVSRIILY